MGKATKEQRDVYYRRAKEDAYRARSAYKLTQIDEEFDIFHTKSWRETYAVSKVVDLCAAPGSWSQVIRRKLLSCHEERCKVEQIAPAAPLIVAIDLQEMAPIDGVIQLQGDISSMQSVKRVLDCFDGAHADLIVCDGAPDLTGMHDMDENLQNQLLLAALRMSLLLLRPNGTFVAKIFKGRNIGWLYTQLLVFFESVHAWKPASSRAASLEHFVICEGLKPLSASFNVQLTDHLDVFHNYVHGVLKGE